MIRYVVFDLDDTLGKLHINWKPTKQKVVELALEHGVLEGTVDQWVEYYMHHTSLELVHKLERAGLKPHLDEIYEAAEHHVKYDPFAFTLFSFTPPLLEALKEDGYGMAIITGNTRPSCEVVVKRYRLQQYFDYLITRTDVSLLKPHPEGLEYVIEQWACDPKEVVMVGDNELADGGIAKAVGCHYLHNEKGENFTPRLFEMLNNNP